VFLVLQSANRDKGTSADPDRFDNERPAKPLRAGSGRGVHACLGEQLARIEAGGAAQDPGPARGHPGLRRGDLAAEHRARTVTGPRISNE
jgi:hypothetical protein